MRLSRPCYDKPRRCPGWIGGGWKWPKGDHRCDSGYIDFGWESEWWAWHFGRCSVCDVLVLPFNFRFIDPTYWRHTSPRAFVDSVGTYLELRRVKRQMRREGVD